MMTWLGSIRPSASSASARSPRPWRARSARRAPPASSTTAAAPMRSATPTIETGSTETRSRLRNDSAARSCASVSTMSVGAPRPESASSVGGALRRRRVERRRVEDRDRAALGVHRQRAAQRRAALLAVDLEGVVARRGAEDRAAADPDRRARRAGAGAAGALLAPRLGAAAADVAARLRRVRAAPARGELRAHGLVHERAVERRAEGGVVELDLLRCAPRTGASAIGADLHEAVARPGHGAADAA